MQKQRATLSKEISLDKPILQLGATLVNASSGIVAPKVLVWGPSLTLLNSKFFRIFANSSSRAFIRYRQQHSPDR